MTGRYLVARRTLTKHPVPGSESYRVGHHGWKMTDNGVWCSGLLKIPHRQTIKLQDLIWIMDTCKWIFGWKWVEKRRGMMWMKHVCLQICCLVNLQTLKPRPLCRDPVRAEAVQTSAKLQWAFHFLDLLESIWKQQEPWINSSHISKIIQNQPLPAYKIPSHLCLYWSRPPHSTKLKDIPFCCLKVSYAPLVYQAARRLLEHWRSQRLVTGHILKTIDAKRPFVNRHILQNTFCKKAIIYIYTHIWFYMCVYTVLYCVLIRCFNYVKHFMLSPSVGLF